MKKEARERIIEAGSHLLTTSQDVFYGTSFSEALPPSTEQRALITVMHRAALPPHDASLVQEWNALPRTLRTRQTKALVRDMLAMHLNLEGFKLFTACSPDGWDEEDVALMIGIVAPLLESEASDLQGKAQKFLDHLFEEVMSTSLKTRATAPGHLTIYQACMGFPQLMARAEHDERIRTPAGEFSACQHAACLLSHTLQSLHAPLKNLAGREKGHLLALGAWQAYLPFLRAPYCHQQNTDAYAITFRTGARTPLQHSPWSLLMRTLYGRPSVLEHHTDLLENLEAHAAGADGNHALLVLRDQLRSPSDHMALQRISSDEAFTQYHTRYTTLLACALTHQPADPDIQLALLSEWMPYQASTFLMKAFNVAHEKHPFPPLERADLKKLVGAYCERWGKRLESDQHDAWPFHWTQWKQEGWQECAWVGPEEKVWWQEALHRLYTIGTNLDIPDPSPHLRNSEPIVKERREAAILALQMLGAELQGDHVPRTSTATRPRL